MAAGATTASSTTASAGAEDKSHVAHLFGRDSLYMLMWAVQIICAALLTPITTRVLGLGEFGTVTSANAIMQVLFVFAGLGLQTAVQREYSTFENPRGARQLILAALGLTVGVSALAWWTVPLWAAALEMGDDRTALRWAVLWAGSSAMTTVSLGLLRSLDKLLMFSAVSFLQSVVAEALALGLVKFYRPTAEAFLGGQVAAQFAAAFLGLVVAPPALLLWREKYVLDRALRFALPLVPAALSTFVLSVSDRLIVEAQLGAEAVARYQVAYNVASMPMLLLSVLNSAWMPRFFGISDEAERRRVLASSRDALYRLMLPVVAGFACGAPLVLRIWAPASYHPAKLHFVVCLVLITAVPYAGQLAVTRTLMAEGRTGASAAATLAAALVNVALNLALVPRFGLEGCAFATLAAYAFLYVLLELIGRQARVPRSPRGLQLQLAGAAVLGLGSAWVQESALTLTLRAVAGVGAGVWFLRVLLTIGQENRETDARTEPVRDPDATTQLLWVGATIEMTTLVPNRRRADRRQARPAENPWPMERRYDDRRATGRHRRVEPPPSAFPTNPINTAWRTPLSPPAPLSVPATALLSAPTPAPTPTSAPPFASAPSSAPAPASFSAHAPSSAPAPAPSSAPAPAPAPSSAPAPAPAPSSALAPAPAPAHASFSAHAPSSAPVSASAPLSPPPWPPLNPAPPAWSPLGPDRSGASR